MIEDLKIRPVKTLILPVRYIVALSVILLSLFISGLAYYRQLRFALDKNYQVSIKTMAVSRNKRINDWYSSWTNKILKIRSDSSITHFINNRKYTNQNKALRNNIENQLKHYSDDDDFGALDILNASGRSVFSSGIKLDEKSIKIESGLDLKSESLNIDSSYFLLAHNNEIRLVIFVPLINKNKKVGSIYVEVNTDEAFGNYVNNILIAENSDLDIYYEKDLKINSLRKKVYHTKHCKHDTETQEVLNIADLIYLNNLAGIISFNDEKYQKQNAYVVQNLNTGWIIFARDLNKENYSYLIEDLSDYLIYGLTFLFIAALLLFFLWRKILYLYSSAVLSDYKIMDLQTRFDHFSKFSHDIFFLLSRAGNIIDFNEKAFHTYGYPIEEFKNLNIRDLRILKDRNKTDSFFKNAKISEVIVFDTTHRKKDKSLFEVEVSMKKIMLNGNEFIQSIIRDVSERIRLDRRLKESKQIFELISSNLNEVIYISNLKPKKEFEYISPTIENLVGYTPEEFYAEPTIMLNLLHPDDRYRIQHMVEGKLEEDRTPARFITKSGETIWVLHRSIERKNSNKEIVGFIGIIKDVSENVKTSLQLKKTQDSFKYIFENNPLPMWIYDIDKKKFVNINKATVKHYGYTHEEFLALNGSFIRNDDQSKQTLAGKSAIETDVLIREETHKLKNGSIIYVEVYSQPINLNGSNENIVLEVIKDITKRKVAEEKIIESEQRFKTLSKISPVAIFRTNNHGELTYVNEYWTEMTGIFPEIAFGKKWWDGLPIQDSVIAERSWKRSISVTNNFESEYQLLNSKSKVKWVLANIVRITGSETKIMGYIGTLTNITRMKMFEGNFRKLYYSVEQSPVSIVITDKKGDIEYINPAVIRITGYNKEELIGNNPRVIQSGYQTKSFYEELWNTISSGQIWNGEFYNKRKDGTYYWEQASISPVFSERGDITNYVAVKEDITTKKKMQEELVIARNSAIESDRIKTNFLKKINHEMRNPLVGIIGVANTIFDEADNPKMKELGGFLIADSKRINNSLKSILSFSSFETEPKYFKDEAVEILEIIKRVSNNFSDDAFHKNIKIKLNDLAVKTNVQGDSEIIADIISFLLDNAIKFTKNGSVTIYNQFGDDEYFLSIEDTGIGIPENKKEIIFEPFVQLDEENKDTTGVGLGLTLAKKYAELLDGRIWFDSKVGFGSTFNLSLKLAKLNLQSEHTKTVSVTRPELNLGIHKKKILIVEDDEINMRVTTAYIKKDYEVLGAANAEVAIDLISQNKFDIILMDIGLKHGLSGIELTKKIRAMQEYKFTPIIAVTAFTLSKDRADIMAAGCSDYLSKPFTKDALVKIISSALS